MFHFVNNQCELLNLSCKAKKVGKEVLRLSMRIEKLCYKSQILGGQDGLASTLGVVLG